MQKTGSSLQLKLIDYDSLFVPTLQGFSNDILGVPNYQHPARRQAKKVSEKSDYFSELVIYLSLCAYAEKPDLWQEGQEQQLLFSVDDFTQPTASSVFRQLKALSSQLRTLAAMKEFCHQTDINHLLPLEAVLGSNNGTTIALGSKRITQPLPAPPTQLLQPQPETSVLPSRPLTFADFENKLAEKTTISSQTVTPAQTAKSTNSSRSVTPTQTANSTQALDDFFNPKRVPTRPLEPTIGGNTRR